jgi:hypothetical protein
MIEYKVREVKRYIVTRYQDDRGSQTKGEYDNQDIAYEVAYSLAKAESENLNLPIGSMELMFPSHPLV